MNNEKKPNPNTIHPIVGYDKEIYIKPTITNKNIIVGDFTYIADSEFESHVTHLYEWNDDKLIIGKFCQIASGVEFIMNGANHQMNAVSTFPFYTLEGWKQTPPSKEDLPLKGDTVIGNDVWIGQNAVILPGVQIGDGAIIGANSVVGSNVDPYTIVAGNPARVIRKRFNDELIQIMEELKWWDLSIDEINELIPILTSSNLEEVKKVLEKRLQNNNNKNYSSNNLKTNKYEKTIVLTHGDYWYSTYNDSAYVLSYITNYKLFIETQSKRPAVMFPVESIDKVIDSLQEYKINYYLKYEDKYVDFGEENNFDSCLHHDLPISYQNELVHPKKPKGRFKVQYEGEEIEEFIIGENISEDTELTKKVADGNIGDIIKINDYNIKIIEKEISFI